jgi:hypothetical protein
MAVTEKRIINIEKTLTRQDEQIARLFSDVTEMREMFVSIRGMWKGALIVMVGLGSIQLGVFDVLLKMM